MEAYIYERNITCRDYGRTEFGGVIAGSLVIENVFAWPGLGRLVIIAIHGRDYPVIQGYILLTMTGFIICNFIAETVCMRVRRRWG